VEWGVSPCPYCGDENPTGANPGDVFLARLGFGLLRIFGHGIADVFKGFFSR
jgi:hypothetical protein